MRHVRAAAAVVRVGTSGLDDGGDRRRHRPRAGAVQPRAVFEAIRSLSICWLRGVLDRVHFQRLLLQLEPIPAAPCRWADEPQDAGRWEREAYDHHRNLRSDP